MQNRRNITSPFLLPSSPPLLLANLVHSFSLSFYSATIAMGTPRKCHNGPSDRPTSRPLVHNPFSLSSQHHSSQKHNSSSTVPSAIVPQTHTHVLTHTPIQTHTPSTQPPHAHNPDSPSWIEQVGISLMVSCPSLGKLNVTVSILHTGLLVGR